MVGRRERKQKGLEEAAFHSAPVKGKGKLKRAWIAKEGQESREDLPSGVNDT